MQKKNVLLWLLTVILLVLAIIFITGATGVLFLLAAVMVAPIPRLRYLVDELISRYAKPAFIVILVIAAVLVIPRETGDRNGGTVDTDKGNAQISTSDETGETEATKKETESTEDETQATSTQVTEATQATEETQTTQPPTEVTESPTEAPTQPPTEPPTEAPTQPPAEDSESSIVFVSWPETIVRGTEGSVTIKGKPNTTYSIKVFYKSGPSSAAGLGDQVSDENGYVTWTWKVSSRTGTGTFKIVVSGGGDSAQVEYSVIEK